MFDLLEMVISNYDHGVPSHWLQRHFSWQFLQFLDIYLYRILLWHDLQHWFMQSWRGSLWAIVVIWKWFFPIASSSEESLPTLLSPSSWTPYISYESYELPWPQEIKTKWKYIILWLRPGLAKVGFLVFWFFGFLKKPNFFENFGFLVF